MSAFLLVHVYHTHFRPSSLPPFSRHPATHIATCPAPQPATPVFSLPCRYVVVGWRYTASTQGDQVVAPGVFAVYSRTHEDRPSDEPEAGGPAFTYLQLCKVDTGVDSLDGRCGGPCIHLTYSCARSTRVWSHWMVGVGGHPTLLLPTAYHKIIKLTIP